jgi:hypothetical protein
MVAVLAGKEYGLLYMKLRRFIQFRLATAFLALTVLSVAIGGFPYWFGSYDPIVDLFLTRPHRTRYAGTNWQGGNERTREFLKWSETLHFQFCYGKLNRSGDFVTLGLDPCWPTTDEQLERISQIKTLRSLTLCAEQVTDQGLEHLLMMPALKEVRFVDTPKISDIAISRFRRAKPYVKAEFTSLDGRR